VAEAGIGWVVLPDPEGNDPEVPSSALGVLFAEEIAPEPDSW